MATFLLTIFRDLTEAIVVGFALGSVLFIHRMSQTTAVETRRPGAQGAPARRQGGADGTTHKVRSDLFAQNIKPPLVSYERSVEVALSKARKAIASEGAAEGAAMG
jgi:MFS superfamily sulfate permease-like transporter